MNPPVEAMSGPFGKDLKFAWQVAISRSRIRDRDSHGFGYLSVFGVEVKRSLDMKTLNLRDKAPESSNQRKSNLSFKTTLAVYPPFELNIPQTPALSDMKRRLEDSYQRMIDILLAPREQQFLNKLGDKEWPPDLAESVTSCYYATSSPRSDVDVREGDGRAASLFEKIWLACISESAGELDNKTNGSELVTPSIVVISEKLPSEDGEDYSARLRKLEASLAKDTSCEVEAKPLDENEDMTLLVFVYREFNDGRDGKGKHKDDPSSLRSLAQRFTETLGRIFPKDGKGEIDSKARTAIIESAYPSNANRWPVLTGGGDQTSTYSSIHDIPSVLSFHPAGSEKRGVSETDSAFSGIGSWA